MQRQALRTALDGLARALRPGRATAGLHPAHLLASASADFDDEATRFVQAWRERLDGLDINAVQRDGFADSLVVFVIGKVKAGKSSLGNYVAYGQSQPNAATRAAIPVAFFKTAGSAMDDGTEAVDAAARFRVGVQETTTAIQGFRRPGLTWIDSPGLHSTRQANGALSLDYLGLADLVLYPMHSSAPGRAGDVAEIDALYRSGKRFVAVITQSDRMDEDIADDGTVVCRWAMKSAASRQGQVDHVRRAIVEGSAADAVDVISLSVRHAEMHHNTPAALKESGLAAFYDLLTAVARSEGVRLKQEAPLQALRHVASAMRGEVAEASTPSLSGLRRALDGVRGAIASTLEHLEHEQRRIETAVLRRMAPVIEEAIEQQAPSLDSAGFAEQCIAALQRILDDEALGPWTLAGVASRTRPSLRRVDKLAGVIAFAPDTIEVKRSNKALMSGIGGVAGGLVLPIVGALLGSVVPGPGTIIGAAIGEAAGMVVGSIGGKAAGKALGSEWTKTVNEGDNRLAVADSARSVIQAEVTRNLKEFFEQLRAKAVNPLERRVVRIARQLDVFDRELSKGVAVYG